MSVDPVDMIDALHKFVAYASRLEGRERGEAQIFLERLFQTFGHAGIAEAGAKLEKAVKRSDGSTRFADLVWKPRVLIEMKARGEKLERHYRQAFEYWVHLTPNRPRYVVLCNFDEFWIYDFDQQVEEPMDRVRVEELPERHTALAFLRLFEQAPLFNNDRVAVTREAADKVALVFNAHASSREGTERRRAARTIGRGSGRARHSARQRPSAGQPRYEHPLQGRALRTVASGRRDHRESAVPVEK